MTSPIYMTRFGTTWHANPECQALDDARLNEGGHILQEPAEKAASRRPCLVCAAPATEWILADDNIGELLNLIGPSKPYVQDLGWGLQWAGLTINPHKGMPKQRAMFGDTICRSSGRYVVRAARTGV